MTETRIREVKEWLYPQLCRFAAHGGRFQKNLANCYKRYENINALPDSGNVDFVDESLINDATFQQVCEWIIAWEQAQASTRPAETVDEQMLGACADFRDRVLNQRCQLEEPCLDNDQTNAVLHAFDETIGLAISRAEAAQKESEGEQTS